MRKKRITAAVIAVVAVAAAIAVFAWRYTYINGRYPPPQENYYRVGDEIKYGELTFCFDGYKIVGRDELEQTGLTAESGAYGVKALYATVTVRNTGAAEENVPVYIFNAEAGGWTNGINMEWYEEINGESLGISLPPGEQAMITLPYLLHQSQFRGDVWENIEDMQFRIVFSLYPSKEAVVLTR